MRTTLDLPDDILRRAKIMAVQRRSSLRQLVIEALNRELEEPAAPRQRLTQPLVRLSHDAPLRKMSLDDIKSVMSQEDDAADLAKSGYADR